MQELLRSTSVEIRWKWTRLSRKDHEEGGEEKEGKTMTVKRPEEKDRLTLEPSSATSNSMEGPEAALDLVFIEKLFGIE